MGACLKGEETLTLRIFGDGPVGGIIADANAKGEVRGYAKNPHVHVPLNSWEKLDVSGIIGNQGSLCVTYDLDMEKPYTGCTPIISGEIAKDLVYYFYTSEQIPAIVSLGVLVGWDGVIAAGGILLQLLPGAEKSLIPKLEKNAAELSDVSHLIQEGETPEGLVERALGGLEFKILGKQRVHFKCRCSKEKLKEILMALGKKEIQDILIKQGKVEAACPFCSHKYLLYQKDLEALLSGIT
jgi:molecular chaperone Hsp33